MGQRHHEVLKKLSIEKVSIFDFDIVLRNFKNTDYNLFDIKALEEEISVVKPDLAIISTNADSHAFYLKICIENNIKNILCEKPLCTSLQDLFELKNLSKKYSNTKIAVNHQMRFIAQYNSIKEIIDSRSMGTLQSINVQAGNFGLAMNGGHYIELFGYLTGFYPQKIWGWVSPQSAKNPRGDKYKDYAGIVLCENALGQHLYINCNQSQGHGIFVNYCFEYGQLFVDELTGEGHLNRRNHGSLGLPTSQYGLPYQVEKIHFPKKDIIESTAITVKTLIEGRNEYPNLQSAEIVIRTIIAAIASSENGHSCVNIDKIDEKYNSIQYLWA